MHRDLLRPAPLSRDSLRLALLPLACVLAVALPVASHAAGAKSADTPEIVRAAVPPQAVGVAHTLRTIPEACARIEGVFTGQATQPYKFAVVRTSPTCQPRARFVDAAKSAPSVKAGWVFNDLIRVPSAACPGQQAVVKVWRKPANVATPALDAQGRARLYLKDSMEGGAAGKAKGAVPMFAAAMAVEGKACN